MWIDTDNLELDFYAIWAFRNNFNKCHHLGSCSMASNVAHSAKNKVKDFKEASQPIAQNAPALGIVWTAPIFGYCKLNMDAG